MLKWLILGKSRSPGSAGLALQPCGSSCRWREKPQGRKAGPALLRYAGTALLLAASLASAQTGTTNGSAYFTGSSTFTTVTPPTVNGLWFLLHNVTGSASVPPSAVLSTGLPAGTAIGSLDTGGPNLTFGPNAIKLNAGSGPPGWGGTPGSCSLSAAGLGLTCLSSTGNRPAYSFNGGAFSNFLLASDPVTTLGNTTTGSGSTLVLNNNPTMVNGETFTESAPTFPTSETTPTAPSVAQVSTSTGNCTAGTHVFTVTEVTALGQTVQSPASGAVTCDGTHKQVTVSSIATGSSYVTGRNVWASAEGTTTPLYLVASSPVIADNTTTSYTFNVSDASLIGVQAPRVDSTSGGTGSGNSVMQNQPIINGLMLAQYPGLTNPGLPALQDVSGSGSLVANTTYQYGCGASNGIGNTAQPTTWYASITTANDGGAHSVRVTCPIVNGNVLAYTFYGRTGGYPSGEPRWRVGIRSASRPLARWGSKGLGGEDVSLFNPREAFL